MKRRHHRLAAAIVCGTIAVAAPTAQQPPAREGQSSLCKSLAAAGAHPLPDSPADTTTLLECGRALDEGDEPRDALRVLQAAAEMALRLDDRRSRAAALVRAGHMSRRLGDAPGAEKAIRESLEISEAIGDRDLLAQGYTALGTLRSMQSRLQEAVELHQRSLQIAEEIDDRVGAAIGHNNVGTVMRAMGDYVSALAHLQQSAAAFEQLGDRRRSATVLDNMGVLYQRLGDDLRTFELESRALGIFESLNDRAGIARSLDLLAGYYRTQGNYAAALTRLTRALELRTADGAVHAIAESLTNIGDLYAIQGNDTQAIAYLQRAIDVNRKAGSASLGAEIQQHLGELYFAQGDDTRALASLERSLIASVEGTFKAQAARTRIAIARVYARQGRLSASVDVLTTALAYANTSGERDLQAEALIEIADCERRLGQLERGLEHVAGARQLAEALDQPELQWRAATTLGRLDSAAGRPAQARRAFDEAMTIVEDLRSQLTEDDATRGRFLSSRLAPYQEQLALAVGELRTNDAFEIAERTKARALVDAIRGGHPIDAALMSPSEQRRSTALTSAVVSMNAQVLIASQATSPDPSAIASLKSRRNDARAAYDDFQAVLYASHPELRAARARLSTIGAREAQGLFPSPSTAIVEFAIAPRGLWAFVIRDSRLSAVQVSRSADQLSPLVERFRDQIANRDLRADETGRLLYDQLLRPIAHLVRGSSALIIVPDGFLWNVPFQALQSAPRHYLIEDVEISYAPSVTVLREAVNHRRSTSDRTLLAFGNPAIGTGARERRQMVLMDDRLDPLPDAETQVKTIGQWYGAASQVYVGSDAREDRWKAEAPRYRVLHLATHGVVDDQSPLYSFVALSPSTGTGQDDGLLEAREIMNMRLNADLVVLSACDTARGRISAGEGVIGLMWAFFVAGSPATLVTEWKVEASSSTELMVAFHKHWNGGRSGVSKTDALRRASIELLKTPAYAHPFYWAGYVLTGDPR